MLRLLKRPAVLVVFALLILLSAALVPSDNANHSTLASLLNPPALSTMHGRPVPVSIYRTPEGLHGKIEAGHDAAPPEGGTRLDVQLFQDLCRRSGIWALTREHTRLKVFDEQGQLTMADWAALPHVIRDAIESYELHPQTLAATYDLTRDGLLERTRILRRGYIHNGLTATITLLLLLGLTCQARDRLLALRDQLRRVRAEQRTRQGLCPVCGYNTDALTVRRCPECGANLSE